MDHHLTTGEGASNTRNGYGRKTMTTDTGKLEIDVPFDLPRVISSSCDLESGLHEDGRDEALALPSRPTAANS